MTDDSLFSELRKRKVIQVAAIYGAVAWGVTEIVVTIVEQLFLPAWVSTLAVIAFVVGFPIAIFLSWTFDVTPDGIQRATIASRRGKVSVVGAVALLVVFTAGLFVLINPSRQIRPSVGSIPNSIAVLPFENVGGRADDEYLVAGLSDELRDQLGRISGLRIAARSSSVAARQQSLDAVSASEKLGVAILVEGSIRRRGNSLIVSVQLVEGRTGLSLWNETFNRTPQELLSVQQSIAEKIARQVLPNDIEIVSTASTRSESANELMLLARYYEQKVREQPEVDFDTLSRAIDLYRRATETDSESALAHSRLAGALMYAGDFGGAEAPIFRAMTLNPELSEVQNTLGKYYWSRGLPGFGVAYKRAVDLNPNNTDALGDYAHWLWMQGNSNEPGVLYRRALELDPLSLARFGALGEFYAHMARTSDALDIAKRIEQMFRDVTAYREISRLMELSGRLDDSIAWMIKARDLQPDSPDLVNALAELYAEIGDFDTALKLEPEPDIGLLYKMRRYEQLIEIAEIRMIDFPDDGELRYLLAFAHNVLGNAEAAIHVLRTTGLPDTVIPEARLASDVEALVTLIDALDGIGETALASEMADWWELRAHTENDNWWILIYRACPLAVSGHDEEALDLLVRAGDSPRLPWESLIRDMPCFQRFADNPRYQDMLDKVERRRTAQRERLPATLAEHGVVL